MAAVTRKGCCKPQLVVQLQSVMRSCRKTRSDPSKGFSHLDCAASAPSPTTLKAAAKDDGGSVCAGFPRSLAAAERPPSAAASRAFRPGLLLGALLGPLLGAARSRPPAQHEMGICDSSRL